MRKRIISILLAFCMVLGCFVGCGKKEGSASGERKLKVGMPLSSSVEDYENNSLTKYVEESLDIEIEFVFFAASSSSYVQQISLMASAGEELPDVFWGLQAMPIATANEFGDAGYFMDLTDLIEKYGTNYKEQFAKLSKAEQERVTRKGTSDSGRQYALPLATTGEPMIDDFQNMMYINQKWLDAVGMKIPTTVDELYAVLKAFKTQDPNGNGQEDEVPMLGLDDAASNICAHVINAYTYMDMNNYFNVTDGKLWAPFVTNEYRDALIYLNKLCSEGLLSELTFSISSAAEYKKFYTPSNGTALVGVYNGHPLSYTDVSSEVLSEYVAFPRLSDATGKGGYDVVRPGALLWTGYITKDCENTELAMEFLDFFYKDETITRVRHGEKGVAWDYTEETGKDMYGKDCNIELLTIDEATNTDSWGWNGLGFLNEKNYNFIVDSEDNALYALYKSTAKALDERKVPEEVAADLHYTADEYEERTQYHTPIQDYILRMLSLFVTGEQNPSNDSEWDKYVKELNNMGLDKYLKLAQKAYDRQVEE